jgi:hypothetical protein
MILLLQNYIKDIVSFAKNVKLADFYKFVMFASWTINSTRLWSTAGRW